jgi:hypothetical protein
MAEILFAAMRAVAERLERLGLDYAFLGLRDYISQAMAELIGSPDFMEALPGHLPADAASQRRLPSLRRKLTGLAERSQ